MSRNNLQNSNIKQVSIDNFLHLLNKDLSIEFNRKIEKNNLTYFAFHAIDKYYQFQIIQRNGKIREITAPISKLKYIQKAINTCLQDCFVGNNNIHGFIAARSIVTNARPHINKLYLLNVDIKNFFPSIEFRRIKTVLQLSPFNFTDELAFLIANICCHNGILPQGAPTSPILSNIVCQRLDRKLHKLARENNSVYTRYADDITFSSNKNSFQKPLLEKVNDIIQSENFVLNTAKTHLLYRNQRQEVTGVVVNQKLNVKRNYIREIRQMLHNWKIKGLKAAVFYFNEIGKKRYAQGKFVKMLKGRIEHLGFVRGKEDRIYQKFLQEYNTLHYPEGKIKIINEQQVNVDLKYNPIYSTEQVNIDLNRHKPIDTTIFLEKFRRSEGLKFLTHDFDKSGQLFNRVEILKIAKEEFESFTKNNLNIKESLWARLNNFAFNEKSKKWSFNHKFYDLNWNATELIEWCKANPHHHPINKDFFYENMFSPFKHSIEVRSPELEKLIREKLIEKLGTHYQDFVINYIDLDKANFYTDVDAFLSGIGSLFASIKQNYLLNKKNNELKISFQRKSDKSGRKRIIRIAHINSVCSKPFSNKRELFGGDFQSAEKEFFKICDWSIISKNPAKLINKINILFDVNTNDTHEKIEEDSIEGFTHELTFYS